MQGWTEVRRFVDSGCPSQVGLHGLGPLNWAGKKIVLSLVTHNIRFRKKDH